jgi:hypothetical protein
MTYYTTDTLQPFILSWNLRNFNENPSTLFSNLFCIKGISPGEYPIDAWISFFLEIPKSGKKKNIVGRTYHAFEKRMKNPAWNPIRIVNLPNYIHPQLGNKEKLRLLIRHWADIHLPDDIPCIALAVKCQGYCYEDREAQSLTVLVIFNDGVCRIITLDWTEGPLEDCITPEWHINSTSILNLKEAIEEIRGAFKNLSLENASYSIYMIPSCLSCELNGKMIDTSYNLWDREWGYNEYQEFTHDLNLILTDILDIFLNS